MAIDDNLDAPRDEREVDPITLVLFGGSLSTSYGEVILNDPMDASTKYSPKDLKAYNGRTDLPDGYIVEKP